jgi:serine protease Do
MASKPSLIRLGAVAAVFLIGGIYLGTRLDTHETSKQPETSTAQPRIPSPTTATPQTETPSPAVAAAPQPSFVGVVKQVMPAVVNISTTRTVQAGGNQGLNPLLQDPFFRRFFGDEFFRRFQGPQERSEHSLGSGVIVDASGYIVTNNHVVAGADEIKVLLGDKRQFTGKVIGTDPKTDVAVVKIDAENLPAVVWGNSDKLDVGEPVIAIGNPFGLNQTVTQGIVSAVGRANVGIADYEDFIQTDAAINPGNSGGALINARGELIGINTAIFSRSGGYMGIGFAVPSNMAHSVMDSLVKSGKVVRGWLGVSIQALTPELAENFGAADTRGALVGEIMNDSPAADAGLKSGDVIVAYDSQPVESPATLRNMVAQTAVGEQVTVDVLRDGKTVSLGVTIAEQPANLAQAERTGKDTTEDTALAGLAVSELTAEARTQLGLAPDAGGVLVSGVAPGSPAGRAGVQAGDVIVQINRQQVNGLDDYRRVAGGLGKEDKALVLVNRRGSQMFLVLAP